ncbi:MAG: hypothetical protein D4R58_00090 [Betaproteobacteria bacterium]|jgi:hypothetical protein|nr:MAG: hypothetical protein D4R58_00090 [Betaproteobacteria bacterium]
MSTQKLVRQVKLNNLQYNALRDPAVYRRCANEPFRIQALLAGKGQARCTLSAQSGEVIAEQSVALPGTFTHEIAFPAAGVRIVTLAIDGHGEKFAQDLRLDVLEHAWVG